MNKFLYEPLPFNEAVKYFKNKTNLPTNRYTDLWHLAHSHQFTVARSAGFDILTDIKNGINNALANGTTFNQFKKELIPILEKKGWFNSVGAETKKAKSRRLQVMYNTNMRNAFAAGRWGQAQELQNLTGETVYFEYVARLDEKTRPQHRSWDGIIRPMDDSFWQHHYAPNGWNCRCTTITHTKV